MVVTSRPRLNGAVLTCNDDQVHRWKEHFEAISNESLFEERYTATNRKVITISPSLAEIWEAIKTLKLNKAASEDGITAKNLIDDPQTAAGILHPRIAAA